MNALRKPLRLLSFLLFYLKEVIISNFRVAYDVLTPTNYANPAIIAMPLDARTDFEILMVANLISMTPGTMSLDVSTDRKTLYIHAMFVEDVEQLKIELKDSIEKKVLAFLR